MRGPILFLGCFLIVFPCQAGTITVDDDGPADFNTIQEGIDDSNDGDTIVVADGTYRGRIDFGGRAITVSSRNGPDNCVIAGGPDGVYFDSGETPASVLSGFTVTGTDPGTGIGCEDSSPTIMNNIIRHNWSEYGMGAVFVHNSSAIIVGNIISGNRVYGPSAGIFCCHGSSPIIANNTIVGNGGWYGEGGVYCTCGATATITNCIFWDNGGYDLYGCSATYSCLEHEHPGIGNIYADPCFMDPGHWDGYWWVVGDYRLQPGSPCVDAGSNHAVPLSAVLELGGNPRIANHTVDMGAYERQSFVLSAYSVVVPEGGTANFTVVLVDEPPGTVEVTVAHYSGDPDITIESGGTLIFDPTNYAQPQTVVLAAAEDGDYLNGAAEIWVSGPGLLSAVVTATEADNEAFPTVLYVDARASGAGDGWSWDDAFAKLQDALAIAAEYSQVEEVRVAQGIYRPAEPFSGDREAMFQIASGVAVRGGYAGLGEPDPNARNIVAYETILSGDLDGNDVDVNDPCDLLDEPSRAENSYHVVSGAWTDATAVLDGFLITCGNGNVGGGMYNPGGSPTVLNCTFTGNSADFAGGAMCNSSGSPKLINCMFTGNSTGNIGGAVMGGHGLVVTNCAFIGNSANGRNTEGGAIFRGEPTLTNCTFIGNSADSGGALNCMYPTVTNCTFIGNQGRSGGAMFTIDAIVTNCTFSENSASHHGGAMWCFSPMLTNCIFWSNRDSTGIDESAQIHPYEGTPVVNHCCVQGWTGTWGGTGNIDSDPCFVAPGEWTDPCNTPADANDDVWVEGDYHLLPWSPCIDKGDNNSVPADMVDLDGDGNTAEPIPWDLDGNPRIVDGNNDGNSVVDMGAYEFWPPIEVPMRFTPQAFNPGSKGRWVKAHFVLPAGLSVEDVDTDSPAKIIEPFEPDIQSDHINVFVNDDGLVEIEAAFPRAGFCGVSIDGNSVEVTALGSLTSGQQFYGTDTIRIIDHHFECLADFASYWLQTDCGKPDWCGGSDLNEDSVVNLLDFAMFDACCIEIITE